jgi:MMPL family
MHAYLHACERLCFVYVGEHVFDSTAPVVRNTRLVLGVCKHTVQAEAFRPPRGTVAFTSNNAFATAFPGTDEVSNAVVYAKTSGATILSPAFKALTMALNATVGGFAPDFVVSFESYYTMEAARLLPSVSRAYVSRDNKTSIVVVSWSVEHDSRGADFCDFLRTIIAAQPVDPAMTVVVTGTTALVQAITETVEEDMISADCVVLPLAGLMLLYMIRSLRLMIIPALSIGVSAAGSFATAYLVTFFAAVFETVPSLMMSLIIAMSIDYSLFLLVRYRDEMQRSGRSRRAVEKMMQFAGHTIVRVRRCLRVRCVRARGGVVASAACNRMSPRSSYRASRL